METVGDQANLELSETEAGDAGDGGKQKAVKGDLCGGSWCNSCFYSGRDKDEVK